MAQWSDGTIFTNGLHLHYYRTGGDKPVLVLLHGFTDSGLCWTPIAKTLEADYDVVMIDARGHGRSDGPITGFTTEQLVSDVVGVLQALDIQQATLLGHSMGAHIAARVAKSYPELVQALVLEDPPWRGIKMPQATPEATEGMKQWETNMRVAQMQSLEERIEDATEYNPRWSQEEIIPWATAQGQFNLEVFAKGVATMSREWQMIMTQLTCPTLLLIGDPSRGAIVTSEVAQQAIDTWQDGTTVKVEGAGHSIRRDQYTAFLTAVGSFLAEIVIL